MGYDSGLSLFLEFRLHPGQDSLIALLRGHQVHIYNVCFQVLRHPQDAQDASQEILLEIARGVGQIEDARTFRGWIYRVALNTALNHKRARGRQDELLRRKAAMQTPVSGTPSEEERTAVIEALARLDDESRCLVIEHYFEKATLEELGKRQGVSTSAVWKRIERAKERLKRSLAGAGLALAIPNVEGALRGIVPVRAAPELIGDAVLAKVTLLAASGGFIVGSKTALSVTTVVTLAVCLTLGIGGGILLLARRSGPRQTLTAVTPDGPSSERSKPATGSGSGGGPSLPNAGGSSATSTVLKARLEDYRRKLDQEFPERSAMKAAGNAAFLWKVSRWKIKELQGIKEEILADPRTFLEFFKADVAGDYIGEVLVIALLSMQLNGDPETDPHYFRSNGQVDASTLPPELLEGLKAILTSESRAQVGEIMGFAGGLQGMPSEFGTALRSLIQSSDKDVQVMAIDHIAHRGFDYREPLSKDEADLLRQYAQDASLEQRALSAVAALVFSCPRGYDTWLLEIAENSSSWAVGNQALEGLIWDASRRSGGGDSAFSNRVLDAISQVIERRPTREHCGTWINEMVTNFPLERTIPLLKRITPATHATDMVDRAKAVVAAFESGNSNRRDLSALLGPAK